MSRNPNDTDRNRILAQLAIAPATAIELAKTLGISARATGPICSGLHRARKIFVSGHHKGKYLTSVYSLGNSPDVPRPGPPPLPVDPAVEWLLEVERRRRRLPKHFPRDPMVAALFGQHQVRAQQGGKSA